jgi:hypothetical protein
MAIIRQASAVLKIVLRPKLQKAHPQSTVVVAVAIAIITVVTTSAAPDKDQAREKKTNHQQSKPFHLDISPVTAHVLPQTTLRHEKPIPKSYCRKRAIVKLRARAKITSHFQSPSIPLSGVAKIRNMPDIT